MSLKRPTGPSSAAALAVSCAALACGCGGAASHCSPRVAAIVGPAGSERAQGTDPGIATCAYRARGAALTVTVDTLPQAYRRWTDAEQELDQNTAGWHVTPQSQPQPVDAVGIGAYWVPAERTLSATDGERLVTVRVTTARRPRQLAVAAARLSLGRPQPPPESGGP